MPEIGPFLLVATLSEITPGPDMASVTRNAGARGRSAAVMTAFGIETGLLIWTGASVLGLIAILNTSVIAFTFVKLAGAAYLIYLGLRTLLGLGGQTSPSAPAQHRPAPEGTAFQQGLFSNLLNPKIAVLFTSLIPQFVQPGASAPLQSTLLALIFVAMGLAWLVVFACFAAAAGGLLRRRRIRRVLDVVTGTVLVGLGARLALDHH